MAPPLHCVLASGEDLDAWLAGFDGLHLDLGTGDGAYALHLARRHPELAVLGLDTCLDNLTKPARKCLANLRFVAADATNPPDWLRGRADAVSVNFPYGSLLRALASAEPGPRARILPLARPGARIEIRVNASAAVTEGIPIETMGERLAWAFGTIEIVATDALRAFPSTWAKRIGHGRPSQALVATITAA